MLAAIPGITHIGTEFLAGGAPGPRRGGARRPPADRLPPLALRAPDRARRATRGATRTRSGPRPSRPSTRPPGRTGSFLAALARSSASCSAGTCSSCSRSSPPACHVRAGCGSSGSSRGPALVGGLAFEIAPYRALQSAGHLLGADLAAAPALALGARTGAPGEPAGSRSRPPRSPRSRSRARCTSPSARCPSTRPTRSFGCRRSSGGWSLYLGAAGRRRARRRRRTARQRVVIEGSVRATGGRSPSSAATPPSGSTSSSAHHRHGSESFVFLGWLTPLAAIAGLVVLLRTRRQTARGCPRRRRADPDAARARDEHAAVPAGPLRRPRPPLPARPRAADARRLPRDRGAGRLRPPGPDRRRPVPVGPGSRGLGRPRGGSRPRHRRCRPPLPRPEGHRGRPGQQGLRGARGRTQERTLVEVPVFLPDVNLGSVYQYYGTVARRETSERILDDGARDRGRDRPQAAPAQLRRLDVLPGRTLEQLGVQEIAFHNGLFAADPAVPGPAWFAWRGLVAARLQALGSRRRYHDPRSPPRAGPAPADAARGAEPRHGLALLGLVRERRERSRDVVPPGRALGLRIGRTAAGALPRRPPGALLRRRQAAPHAHRQAGTSRRFPCRSGSPAGTSWRWTRRRCRRGTAARKARGSSRTYSVDPHRPRL